MEFFEIEPALINETELQAYHELRQLPINKPLSYVAFPWEHCNYLYYLNGGEFPLDFATKLSNLKLKYPGFTVGVPFDRLCSCFHLLHNIGIKTVFTPGVPLGITQLDGIDIIPFPYAAQNPALPGTKNILYSFIGNISGSAVRKKLVSMSHPKSCIIIKRGEHDNCLTETCLKEFKDVLSHSRFSLCPRGYQPNSIRFYESLCAGAIPILISDKASLPDGFDWDTCIIKIAEKDIEKISEIISAIPEEKEQVVRCACFEAYKTFSGKNLVSVIRRYYQD